MDTETGCWALFEVMKTERLKVINKKEKLLNKKVCKDSALSEPSKLPNTKPAQLGIAL